MQIVPYLLGRGNGVAALEDGSLQRGQILLCQGIVAAYKGLVQSQHGGGNGAVQLQRSVIVQIGVQRELELLLLQLQLLNLRNGVQRTGIAVAFGNGLSHADFGALGGHMAQGAAAVGEHFFVAHQIACGVDGFLGHALIGHGGGKGRGKVMNTLHDKIQQHSRQQRDKQKLERAGRFHGITSFRFLRPPPSGKQDAAGRWWRWRVCR